jgi:hypothetical protein
MAQQVINVGAAADDHTGDPLRTSFQKTNTNFTELYSAHTVNGSINLTGSYDTISPYASLTRLRFNGHDFAADAYDTVTAGGPYHYNIIFDAAGLPSFWLGDATLSHNWYQQDTHHFTDRTGNTQFLRVDGGGLTVPNGSVNITGNISVTGVNAAFVFDARDGGLTWLWYAQSGNAYLYNTSFHEALGVYVDSSSRYLMFVTDGGTAQGNVGWSASWGTQMFNNTGGGQLVVGGSNNLYFSGNYTAKPGGGAWQDSSDARIKTIDGDYTSGLEAVCQLEPVLYQYKGNDAVVEGGDSPHANVIGQQFIGMIAQAVEPVMPEMVTKRSGFIDGVAVDDLRSLDTTPLVYALVNAVKELTARLEAVEAKLP